VQVVNLLGKNLFALGKDRVCCLSSAFGERAVLVWVLRPIRLPNCGELLVESFFLATKADC
jgi:hypothetical protein